MRVFARHVRSVVAVLLLTAAVVAARGHASTSKLDPLLSAAASQLVGKSKVVVTAADRTSVDAVAFLIQQLGGSLGRPLSIINGQAATIPNAALMVLADSNLVKHVALDRLVLGAMERTGATIGAASVREELGLDGAGVGVAVIDSGVASSADDLTDPSGSQRIERFVDFVNERDGPYDDYGHGTHVAGIIAGNGYDSSGARVGVAPASRLVVLKALAGSGRGRISNVIAALDYAVAHRAEFNIRVVNLSIGAPVSESYDDDPLTIAAQRAVEAGMVVVAAAGNNGRNREGRTLYGAITAPGNAPWVLTVGASSHMGTTDRADDTMAAFSSRGPTLIDRAAKPDLVAPGVGIESLSAPDSLLYNSMPAYLLSGTVSTPYLPYLSLSGTSMAAPVVAGTVALMLQANPNLTPNAVKAILQYTAEDHSEYDALTEGAGFLDARGAVDLARLFAGNAPFPSIDHWSRQMIWGNSRVTGGWLLRGVSAWSSNVTWGASASGGRSLAWGSICVDGCDTDDAAWTTWGPRMTPDGHAAAPTAGDWDNVVWGYACNGADCPSGTSWSTSDGDSVVWGSTDGDSVVWGSADGDSVVWGSGCADSDCYVVWNNQ